MHRFKARRRRAVLATGARTRAALLLSALMLIAVPLVASQAGAALSTANPPTFEYKQDENGADDQPGQKDLSSHAVATPAVNDLWVSWQWDVTSLSGGNTGDGCALFDRDGDSKVNFAICVTIQGAPATQATTSPRVYTCGDGKVDRCTSTYTRITPINSACTTNTNGTDPFHAGQKDTQAICHVDLNDVGGAGTANLVNTCSYPSQEPTSAPSDCVLIPRDAFLRVTKNVTGGTSTSFPFRLWTGTTEPTTATVSVTPTNGTATSDYIPIRSDVTYKLKEVLPTNWQIDGTPSCTGASTSNGSFTTDTISGIDASPDNQITCTFTDKQQTGAIEITKQRDGDSTIKLSGAHFSIDGAGDYVTGTDGKVCVPGLSLGSHTVTETAAPNGHSLASPASQTKTIANAGTCTAGATPTSAVFNDPVVNGTISIHKSGVGGADLPGVKFTLWTNVAPLTGGHGTGDVEQTSLTCTTNSDGDCSISNIPLGNYWIVETVPAGYIGGADQALTIGVGASPGTGDDQQTFSFENSAAPGTINIHKTGLGGAALEGAVFALYYDNGLNAGDPTAVRGLEDTATGATCTTNGSGDCSFTDVAPGDYWIVETTAPNGYDKAADKQVEVGFGSSAGSGATVGVTIIDPVTPGTVRITKRDDASNLLDGAEFTLYRDVSPFGGTRNQTNTDPITDPVKKCTTLDGTCDLTGVAPGKYWVVETDTPDHYDTAPDQAIEVGIGTAPETGATVPVSFVNPRQHRIVVLVCHEGTDTLSSRDVTIGGQTKASLGAGSLTGAQQKALCDTGGASFGDISGHPDVTAEVKLAGSH